LKNCLNYPRLRQALENLPKTLDDTYTRILQSIADEDLEDTAKILNLLIWSNQTFTTNELVDAVMTNLDGEPTFDPKNRMPVPRDVLRLCSSLVTVSQDSRHPHIDIVRLAHFSVKEYLVSYHVSKVFRSLIGETVARKYLTRLCLSYLIGVSRYLIGVSRRVWFWKHTGLHHQFEDLYVEFPFALYSAKNWMEHARQVINGDEHLSEMVLSFFLEKHKALMLFAEIYDAMRTKVQLYRRPTWYSSDCRPREPPVDFETPPLPLFYAASGGLDRTINTLLDRGADINAMHGDVLIAALENSHETTVRLLLNRGADVNTQVDALLVVAMRKSSNTTIELLLDRCVDEDAAHCFALMIASRRGRDTTVELLLDRGVDVNAGDGAALCSASEWGHDTTVKLLLDRGVDVNAGDGAALCSASRGGYDTIVKLLLDRGADVNAGDGAALCSASRGGYDTIVKLLLDRGADVNAGDGAALCSASKWGHDTVVQLLLDRGADLNAGHGKAFRAASDGGCSWVVQLLLDAGAKPDYYVQSTPTALEQTMEYIYEGLVTYLQRKMSRAEVLESFELCGFVETAQLLVDNGADTNFPGGEWFYTLCPDGWTAEFVKQILERDAYLSRCHLLSALLDTDPQAEAIVSVMLPYLTLEIASEQEDDSGMNMLCYAVYTGSEAATQRCLDLGVDVHLKYDGISTAVDLAGDRYNYAILMMLVQAGGVIRSLDDHDKDALEPDSSESALALVSRLYNERSPYRKVASSSGHFSGDLSHTLMSPGLCFLRTSGS
jgi:ankyrin repeat protein